MKKIKLNDRVEVIAGKDKGLVGKVIKSFRNKDQVIVEKVNMIKRHTKPNMANQQGGIIDKEASINVSNVMLLCPNVQRLHGSGQRFWMMVPRFGFARNVANQLKPRPDQKVNGFWR